MTFSLHKFFFPWKMKKKFLKNKRESCDTKFWEIKKLGTNYQTLFWLGYKLYLKIT